MSQPDPIVQGFVQIHRCSPLIAKSASEAALKTLNRGLPMILQVEAIKSRVALIISYYRDYIQDRQLFYPLGPIQVNDIIEHINKVINESPVENTYQQTLTKLLQLPSPQTGGKRKGRKWTMKYKRSINCRAPRGFSQRQYCKYGRRNKK